MLIREPEPDRLNDEPNAAAYAAANFSEVNAKFVAAVTASLAASSTRLTSASSSERVMIDLGCGPGDITTALARKLPTWRIIGVDAAEPMFAIGRRRCDGVGNVQLELARIESFRPVAPADAVVSNTVLHEVYDPAAFWACVKRSGRCNALVHVRDLVRPDSDASAKKLVSRHAASERAALREAFYRSLLAAWTLEELRQQLDGAGLSGFTITPVSDHHVDIVGRLP